MEEQIEVKSVKQMLIALFNEDWPKEFNSQPFRKWDISAMEQIYMLEDSDAEKLAYAIIKANIEYGMDVDGFYINYINPLTFNIQKPKREPKPKLPNNFNRNSQLIPEAYFRQLGYKIGDEGFETIVVNGYLNENALIEAGVNFKIAKKILKFKNQYLNAKTQLEHIMELDKYDEDIDNRLEMEEQKAQ